MRPFMVVFGLPGIHRALRFRNGLEWPGVVKEVGLQGLRLPLDLANGGRRVRPCEQLPDPVLAADPLKQHVSRAGPAEPADEHLPVIAATNARHTDPFRARTGPSAAAGATRYRHAAAGPARERPEASAASTGQRRGLIDRYATRRGRRPPLPPRPADDVRSSGCKPLLMLRS